MQNGLRRRLTTTTSFPSFLHFPTMSSPFNPGSPRSNSSHQSDDVPLGLIAEAVIRDSRVDNTRIAYDRVIVEWKGFCAHTDPQNNDQFRSQLVTPEKLSNFLCYQVFRAKQKVGGISGGGRGRGRRGFDHDEYEKLKLEYQDHFRMWQSDDRYRMPDPEGGGIGISAMIQYRAALKGLYEEQKQRDPTLMDWKSIWSYHATRLFRLVKTRKARIDRENFREKTNHDFSGYHALDQLENIENEFWKGSFNASMKTAFPYMRYRMLFLYTTSGILRCESLMKAELSDFQGITLKKQTDIDPIYVMITQIAEGRFSLRM